MYSRIYHSYIPRHTLLIYTRYWYDDVFTNMQHGEAPSGYWYIVTGRGQKTNAMMCVKSFEKKDHIWMEHGRRMGDRREGAEGRVPIDVIDVYTQYISQCMYEYLEP